VLDCRRCITGACLANPKIIHQLLAAAVGSPTLTAITEWVGGSIPMSFDVRA
jgi:hypothetical protein